MRITVSVRVDATAILSAFSSWLWPTRSSVISMISIPRAEHGPHRVLQEQPQLSRIPNSAERFGNLVWSRAEAGNRGCSELLLQENVHRESQSLFDRRASLRTSFH